MIIQTKNFINTLLFFLLVFSGHILNGQGAYPLFEDNNTAFTAHQDFYVQGVAGDRVFFWNKGHYVTDGTQEGTVEILADNLGFTSYIGQIGSTAYFMVERNDVYYISKIGATENALTDLYSNEERPFNSLIWKDNIYFHLDSETSFGGDDLIKLNLDTNESEIVFTSEFGGIRGLGATNTELLFIANIDNGKYLVSSDGTFINTYLVKLLFGDGSSFAQQVFMESDGQNMWFFYHPSNEPYHLWYTDGSKANTKIVGTYDLPSFGLPFKPFAFLDNKFYFIMRKEGAPSGQTFDLHVSDGSTSGTYNLNEDPSKYWFPKNLHVFNNKIYFSSLDYNWGLYTTNGEPGNKEEIIAPFGFQEPNGVGGAFDYGIYNDKLVIQTRRDDVGFELFTSDGTPNNATLLADINPGEEDSAPRYFNQIGDNLFFIATRNGVRGIWIYDPTFQVDPCANGIQVDSVIMNGTGGELGSAVFTPSGDNPPFMFSLNNGPFTSNSIYANLTAGLYTMSIIDAQGCTIEFQFNIDVETNIFEPDHLTAFSIHPNPAIKSDYLVVDFSLPQVTDDEVVEFVNFQGQVIETKSFGPLRGPQSKMLTQNGLPAGIYLINLKSGNQLLGSKKLMILE